ncbi:hypothetical protein MHYP_G00189070 [Metynnis hypsauchen]
MSQAEEEFYKEALRHASSDSKHSKRKIELISRHLQLLAAMDQHMQKYRSQAFLLDNLVETFFMDREEETRRLEGCKKGCKKRHPNGQKSPDVNEGETQSTEKAVEDPEMSQAEEEFYKEALRHASSDSKHSKRKIELISRHLQLLAAMDQHMQKYRSQLVCWTILWKPFLRTGMWRPEVMALSNIRCAGLQLPPAHSSSE